MRTDIKISVKLNNTNDDSYFDTVSKLLDDLADTIEDSGHEFIMCYSKPDEEDNGFNYDIIDSLNELENRFNYIFHEAGHKNMENIRKCFNNIKILWYDM